MTLSFKSLPSQERSSASLKVTIEGFENESYLTQNISEIGLFVADLTNLRPQQRIILRIEIPPFKSYRLECLVVHVVDRAKASKLNRSTGSGLFVLTASDGYFEVVEFYLRMFDHLQQNAVLLAQANELLRGSGGDGSCIQDLGSIIDPLAATV